MRIIGLDFETSGLDANTDRVIEIGAVVWETHLKKPLTLFSTLVMPPGLEKLPTEVQQITGISMEYLREYGREGKESLEYLTELMDKCDFVVAHNAHFDRSFLEKEIERYEINYSGHKNPWLDTMLDLPFSDEINTRKLVYLAAEHGFLNPFSHRAVFDTLTMLEILGKYDIEEVIYRNSSPSIKVISHVTYEEKDQAKEMGFRWDNQARQWYKQMKKCDLQTVDFPFKISIIDL